MDQLEALEIISRGEDSQHQFKLDVNNETKIASEMAAFANSKGGYIFIGVDNLGNIVGLTDNDIRRINQLISNASTNSIKNPIIRHEGDGGTEVAHLYLMRQDDPSLVRTLRARARASPARRSPTARSSSRTTRPRTRATIPRSTSSSASPVRACIAVPLEGEDGDAMGAIALYNKRSSRVQRPARPRSRRRFSRGRPRAPPPHRGERVDRDPPPDVARVARARGAPHDDRAPALRRHPRPEDAAHRHQRLRAAHAARRQARRCARSTPSSRSSSSITSARCSATSSSSRAARRTSSSARSTSRSSSAT